MDMIYYIILGITVISYLLGLFLSYFEKKGKISVLSGMGNVGFINVFGVNTPPPGQMEQQRQSFNEGTNKFEFADSKYVDDEII